MFAEIISLENLFLAWREFKRGKGRKLEVQQFELNLEDNIFQLHSELASQTYQHSNYTAFYITDPKPRHIHKACMRDRVLHHAIFRVLYPIFDKSFIYDSYSCRLTKGTHRAVRQLKSFCQKLSGNNSRNIFALKCDVKKFFDSMDQTILLCLLKKRIANEKAVQLISRVIDSYCTAPGKGLPIGNVTSQLFANICLNELDQFAKHELKTKFYLRYCDDFVILVNNQQDLRVYIEKISDFLKNILQLSLHPNKIIIRNYRQGIDFLGYVVRPYCTNLRTRTKRRIIKRISPYNLASYLGVLKHCRGHKIEGQLRDIIVRNGAGG